MKGMLATNPGVAHIDGKPALLLDAYDVSELGHTTINLVLPD